MLTPDELERLTAFLWVALAVAGVLVRCRRLAILYGLAYEHPRDQEFLATVRRSSWIRLTVKVVLLIGGTFAYLANPIPPAAGMIALAFWVWRLGLLSVLGLLLVEDLGVDRARHRLGEWGRLQQAQQDRMERTGADSNERLRRGHIGDTGEAG